MKTCEGCKYAEVNHKDAPCSIIGSYPKVSDNCGRELKAKLEKLAEQGTKDWADVPNVTKWVEEQRGIEQEGCRHDA